MRTIVYSFLVMDLPHWGHVHHIQRARELGDILVVGILDDDTVEGYKRRPIMSLEERMKLANQIKGVDLVIPQFEKFPLQNLLSLNKLFPNDKLLCVHGSDWKQESFCKVTEYLETIGGELVLLPYYKATSTTNRIEEMARRYMSETRESS